VVTWVAVHEVCHAVQFAGAPWLREHLGEMVQSLLRALRVTPSLDLRHLDVRAILESVREHGVVGVALGPERTETLERIQATMSLIEGHAEWAMDEVGAEVVPEVERLRGAMDQRRHDRHPLLKIIDRLLGFELKLRQYEQGKRFCDAVEAAGGPDALRRAFDGPESLPTMAELEEPDGWLARTCGYPENVRSAL
jgi:coenzyme F420 biosynthesis associated uncharacterized protein